MMHGQQYYLKPNFTRFFHSCGLLLLILVLLSLLSPAHALESSAKISARDTVTLVSDVDTAEPGKTFSLGLRFRLAPGWHIYWLNPGDAGQAPVMHWALPAGSSASAIQWPVPVRISEGPAMVFAYQNEVTLPVEVNVPSSLQSPSFDIELSANWLVCADVCEPESGKFKLSLPISTTLAKPSAETALFAASAARMPQVASFTTQLIQHDLYVSDKNFTSQSVSDAWFFPSVWGAIDNAAPQKLAFNDNGFSLALKPGQMFNPKAALSGVLVIKDNQGQEKYYSIEAKPNANAALPAAQPALLLTLLFALLGGLILNLMPCVFPILAMKALSIVKLSGVERHVVRGQALFYTLGILTAFVILDVILLAFRMAGKAAGWGFQFQSPVFVMVVAWLLFALGLNLSGVYEIGGRVMGLGDKYTHRKGLAGSFFTGLLVVVAATPCVAPFIGAAVAAALTASPLRMLLIFLAMGLGLALPYLLLAVFPSSVRILPRPGRWMEILKQALAFPMYGACVWLVWVLSQQIGASGVAISLAGMLGIWLLIWLSGSLAANAGGFAKSIVFSFVVLTLLSLSAFLYAVSTSPLVMTAAPVKSAGLNEEAYSAASLAALRAQGKAVFVNMTAAWCITCLVNEKVALSSDAVKEAFKRHQVTYLIGDWTEQQTEITEFLHEHQHDGVPLYVFYPEGINSKPVVLPQILTPSTILDIINHKEESST